MRFERSTAFFTIERNILLTVCTYINFISANAGFESSSAKEPTRFYCPAALRALNIFIHVLSPFSLVMALHRCTLYWAYRFCFAIFQLRKIIASFCHTKKDSVLPFIALLFCSCIGREYTTLNYSNTPSLCLSSFLAISSTFQLIVEFSLLINSKLRPPPIFPADCMQIWFQGAPNLPAACKKPAFHVPAQALLLDAPALKAQELRPIRNSW